MINIDFQLPRPPILETKKQQPIIKAVTCHSSRTPSPFTNPMNTAQSLLKEISLPVHKKKSALAQVAKKKKPLPKSSAKVVPKEKEKTMTGRGEVTWLSDGIFETWSAFGDAGSYGISGPRWRDVSDWVLAKSKDYDFIAENVAFHHLVVDMKTELKLESARDSLKKIFQSFRLQKY
jgi:hypothetical protein